MDKGEKKLICFLLIGIIVGSSILIFKIKSEPEYDEALYNEIYSEYEEILAKENESYSEEDEENVAKTENTVYMNVNSKGQKYRVAGQINIPKIGVNYPIVYETSEEYLKIAPTKLFGPDINEPGNVCIVGHNYKNQQFFSRLSELENNDKIDLLDNKGKRVSYFVYDKYEVPETDLSCTNQNTNGKMEATLITCTKKKSNRLVVKCRAIT